MEMLAAVFFPEPEWPKNEGNGRVEADETAFWTAFSSNRATPAMS
jgi:hypothetical protein